MDVKYGHIAVSVKLCALTFSTPTPMKDDLPATRPRAANSPPLPDSARWERFGREHPYFAVLVDPNYRGRSLEAARETEFFRTGEEHVAGLYARFAELAGAPFRPNRVLDFGCGVGRLTLPFARRASSVVGVDVAESMCAVARTNAARFNLTNMLFEATLSHVEGRFDLLHSYITFQHISPTLGLRILEQMLGMLAPSGFGALHFTFRRRVPLYRRIVNQLRRRSDAVNGLVNTIQGRSFRESFIPMYNYDREAVLALLRDRSCTLLLEERTDHGGHEGAMLYFCGSRGLVLPSTTR